MKWFCWHKYRIKAIKLGFYYWWWDFHHNSPQGRATCFDVVCTKCGKRKIIDKEGDWSTLYSVDDILE